VCGCKGSYRTVQVIAFTVADMSTTTVTQWSAEASRRVLLEMLVRALTDYATGIAHPAFAAVATGGIDIKTTDQVRERP
jgi:hypothetical protein